MMRPFCFSSRAQVALQRGQGAVGYCSINPSGLPVAEIIEKK